MDKKLIFNEHGERGTQSMIGGNTTNPVSYTHLPLISHKILGTKLSPIMTTPKTFFYTTLLYLYG